MHKLKINLYIVMMIAITTVLLLVTGCQTNNVGAADSAETKNLVAGADNPEVPTAPTVATPTPILDPSKIKLSVSPFELANLDGGGPVFSLAFSPDDKFLAMAGFGQITIWDLKNLTRKGTLEGHTDIVMELDWTPDGSTLVSVSLDGTLILWNMETYSQADILEIDQALILDISPNGKQLAVSTLDGEVQVWGIETMEKQLTLLSPTNSPVISVKWSPDGSLIAFGEPSGNIHIWDMENDKVVNSLEGYGMEMSSANDMDWSPDGSILATGHDDGKVHLWDTGTWELIRTIDAHNSWVSCLAWLPYGKVLATGGGDHSASIWDIETGQKITGGGSDSDVYSIAWSPSGKFLAAGSGGMLTSPSGGVIVGSVDDWEDVSEDEEWKVNFNEEAGYCLLYLRLDY